MLVVNGYKLENAGAISGKWAQRDGQSRIGKIAVVVAAALEMEALVPIARVLKIDGDEIFAIHAITRRGNEVENGALSLSLHRSKQASEQEKDGINDVFHARQNLMVQMCSGVWWV